MMDMLRYFISFSSHNKDILTVCQQLNTIKSNIEKADFTVEYSFEDVKAIFHNILEYAISIDDEILANSQFVFLQYFLFFVQLSEYYKQLQNKEYRVSWNTLQNCFDCARTIGRFVDVGNRLDVQPIIELLLQYESLYPFTVFASSEYIISKSHCSICGKSMLNLECPHRKGYLYWGKMAVEIIDEVEEIQAIAMVSNPEDKRCVLELEGDKNGTDKYIKLEQLMKMQLSPLRMFTIEKYIEIRQRDSIKKTDRNALCPCGSGLKYKKCCGRNLYYQHEINKVKPGKKVGLVYL